MDKRQRRQRAAEELVDALDAVSAPMAERILGRAIAADSQRQAKEQNTFDYEELRKIAGEVGVSEESLQQALLEEFDTDLDRNPSVTERLTLPDEVRGGVIIDRPEAELAEALEKLTARIQERMAGRAEAVVEAVQQPDGLRTLVEVRSSTTPNRRRGLWLIVLLVLFGPLLGQLLASVLFLGVAAIAVVSVVAFMKGVARRFRRAVNEGLSGLVEDNWDRDRQFDGSDWISIWERSRRRKS